MKTIKTLSLCGLLMTASLCCNAQTISESLETFISSDVSIYNKGSEVKEKAYVDTGCTYCVVDSTYAFDKLGVTEDDLRPATANIEKTKVYLAVIDSITFCDYTYKEVVCFLANLKQKFQEFTPDFLIGASILKTDMFMIDTNHLSVQRMGKDTNIKGTVYNWKDNREFKDVAIDYIVLEAKSGKKPVRFVFDTGAASCKLPKYSYNGETKTIKRKRASLEKSIEEVNVEIAEGVDIKINNDLYNIDFIIADGFLGILNHNFLKGKKILLNYETREMTVID